MDGDRLKPACQQRILLLVLFMMLLLLRLSQQHSQSAARLCDLCSLPAPGLSSSHCASTHTFTDGPEKKMKKRAWR